ncbi:MAG: phycobiliprotein lyase [Cyanobacteria bacterium]|nr:phycobiliprotein lyase [Cyanobacteria bacterium bin.51]
MGASQPGSAVTGSPPSFPPTALPAFLELCAGRWMGLRSQFTTSPTPEPAPPDPSSSGPGDDDAWHSSEKGDVVVSFEPSSSPATLGSLVVTAPTGTSQRLLFQADGSLSEEDGSAGTQAQAPLLAHWIGQWQLWTDGSLELSGERGGRSWKERIWFTKPNLRLRSRVEHNADGSAASATFCSEIRRVAAA